MEQTPLIQLSDICFAYEGQVALRHITLDILKGECIILDGPNGCGKSTLVKLLNGLIFPEQGSYRFDGEEICAKSLKSNDFARRFHQRMGLVFQNADVQLFCPSVWEELAFGPRQMGLKEEEVRRRVMDAAALLGITHLMDRAPYHLSGGEKRKVSLACILTMNPDVLVLDEPIAGLDRKSQETIRSLLCSLKQAGKTLIIATHNDSLAELLGDRVISFTEEHGIL